LFFNVIKDGIIFCLIFQNSNVPVIRQFQWLILAEDESHETFDVILSTKYVFFLIQVWWEAAALQPLHPQPPFGYDPGSQNTYPNEILDMCVVFLYGVNMILFILRNVCEETLENFRNLRVRIY
jgi:hypothetical protein